MPTMTVSSALREGTNVDALEAWEHWSGALRGEVELDTWRQYTAAVLRFLAFTGLARVSILAITRTHVQTFYGEHVPRGHARLAMDAALRSLFRWAVFERVVPADENPMIGVKVRRPPQHDPLSLTGDELARLLNHVAELRGERAAQAVLLGYLLGLRRKELAGLRWENIVETATGPVMQIRVTKGQSFRDLPLDADALAALERLRTLPYRYQRLTRQGFIVGVARDTVSEWVHKAGQAAGIDPQKAHSHILRASFATDALVAGADVRTVQKILGHAKLETTMRYLAVTDERKRRTMGLVHAPTLDFGR